MQNKASQLTAVFSEGAEGKQPPRDSAKIRDMMKIKEEEEAASNGDIRPDPVKRMEQ